MTPWILDGLWNSPGQNTGRGSLSLLQGIFPTQGWNPILSSFGWFIYQLSYQGSPRILDLPPPADLPRNWTRVSCIASGFFFFLPTELSGKLLLPTELAGKPTPTFLGFSCGSAGKASACNAGDLGDTWVGKIPWRRERLPIPVFWPGEFHGLYSPWCCKESDTTEQLSLSSSPRRRGLMGMLTA